jgi:hypothetical protein
MTGTGFAHSSQGRLANASKEASYFCSDGIAACFGGSD